MNTTTTPLQTGTSNIIQFPLVQMPGLVPGSMQENLASAEVIDFLATGQRYCRSNSQPISLTEAWEALTENRLQVHYQPQHNLKTGEAVSAEALVRLIDTDGELIYPDRFIDRAEQCGMIAPLGRQVIQQVCADLQGWRQRGLAMSHVSINVSANQLRIDSGLLDYIDRQLNLHGLDYTDLEFELIERQQLSSDAHGITVLNELSRRGSRIAIDDFGTGYSSLMYLTDLPVDTLKLDRSLVTRLDTDKAAAIVTRNLVNMATDMDIEVVAEGIETDAQHQLLLEFGCTYGQSFRYAKPMTDGNIQTFLSSSLATGFSH